MRGLSQFQINQMKSGDPRMAELFRTLRLALDLLEDVSLNPHVKPEVKNGQAPRNPTRIAIERLPEKIAYSIKEVRALTGISNAKIYNEIKLGRLRSSKNGGRTLILANDLQEWVNSWIVSPNSKKAQM